MPNNYCSARAPAACSRLTPQYLPSLDNMFLFPALPCISLLLLKAILVLAPPTDTGYLSTILRLPDSSGQCIIHSASEFCKTVAPDTCPQGGAAVRSLELRKFISWTNWRHEFIILAITFGEVDYFIHLNRAWAGTGWWEYIPYLTWGSLKPAEDDVSIYRSGEDEARERDGTELIAKVEFYDGVLLRDIASRLALRINLAGPYSLFGMNCWTWSRYLTLDIARKWKPFIWDVQMPKKRGRVDATTLLMELDLDPWVNWAQFTINKAMRPSLTRRLLHGISPRLHDKFFPKVPLSTPSFVRSLELTITNKGSCDSRGSEVQEAPHVFTRQWAVDSNEHSASLSSPGDMLYLLTPPLLIPKPIHRVEFRITAKGIARLNRRPYRCDTQCVWFETAIVQHISTNNTHRVASKRFRIPWNSSDASSQLFRMDGDHELVQQLESGNEVGVWAGAQCPGWENHVMFVALSVVSEHCNGCQQTECCIE